MPCTRRWPSCARGSSELERGATLQLPAGASGNGDAISALDPSFRAQELSFVVVADRRQRRLGRRRRAAQLARAAPRPPARRARRPALRRPRARRRPRPAPLAVAAEQRPRRRRPRPRGARRQPHRRPARLLGRARDALGAALQRAEHRRERAARPARHRRPASSSAACSWCSSAPTPRCCGCCSPSPSCSPASRPPTISFAAGQAAFTLTLLILFNILAPEGWKIGLVRIEDIALGSAVSLAVGLLFWPRGAGAALRPGAGRGLRRQRQLPRGRRAVRHRALRRRRAAGARADRRRRCAPRRPRAASTTPSAATSPSAAPSRSRSPR